jgi:hypothetical protein
MIKQTRRCLIASQTAPSCSATRKKWWLVRMVLNDAGRVPIVDPKTRQVVGLVARKDLLQTRLDSHSAQRKRTAYFRNRKPEGNLGRRRSR